MSLIGESLRGNWLGGSRLVIPNLGAKAVAVRKETGFIFAVTVVALVFAAIATAASQQALRSDDLVGSYLWDHHVPGLSMAVIDHGKVVLVQG